MLFRQNYFNIKMNGKKVKIDTDKTEFTVTVKNGKAIFKVEAEPIITDECSDYCDCCPGCDKIEEIVVEDNEPAVKIVLSTTHGVVGNENKPKAREKEKLDTV